MLIFDFHIPGSAIQREADFDGRPRVGLRTEPHAAAEIGNALLDIE
jgi:hypothetical protein